MKQIRIATWNVNSLRMRMEHVLKWLAQTQPDIVALQETKTPDDKFPLLELQSSGYQVIFTGQKSYNGVALLSRETAKEEVMALPHWTDPQRRFIAATYEGIRVINVYVPNGASVGSEKYEYKLQWLACLRDYLQTMLKQFPYLVVLGDFNIAPDDRDIYAPQAWIGHVMVSDAERSALRELHQLGLQDTFRLFDQPPQTFSWWDYRGGSFQRNLGARIDLILAAPALRCTTCTVDPAPRHWETPSDHAPVVATFDHPLSPPC